jgi:uncharacterized protein YyaL (SSP411 family)
MRTPWGIKIFRIPLMISALLAGGGLPFLFMFQSAEGSSPASGSSPTPGSSTAANPKKREDAPSRLASEKSPYLLMHADNPVDWYPWGPEAFEKARREDKPIFLSIGYSSCHWCHVMEHESFQDPEIAGMMNDVFISIIVDREERPDIDDVYMTVSQILTGSGGWPLTIIMTPDKKPFYAATYIPKEARFGRPGMKELIPRIQQVWKDEREQILNSTERIMDALQKIEDVPPGEDIGSNTLTMAYEQLYARYDPVYGGFGNRPKFPTAHNIFFLLRYWRRSGDEKALDMVEKTLNQMRKGGIYDQVGHGFHRYSVDREWIVPHFEKMLYDQALLAIAYTEVYQATGKEEYRKTASQVLDFVLYEMTAPEKAFYTAFDADSEGEEGVFYLWTKAQIETALGKKDAEFISRVFNIYDEGNYNEETTGAPNGKNIFYLNDSWSDLSEKMNIQEQELEQRIETLNKKLYDHRKKREAPLLDDKILTDWNGLMIAAFAKAARAFGNERYARAGEDAASFILKNMLTPRGRLLHRYGGGQAAITSHIDDYAFFIWGLLELYETTLDEKYLKTALDLNSDMMEFFLDEEKGGFFSTPDDGEKLLVRKKENFDGAIPSGNSVVMLNLLRLSRITANPDLEKTAEGIGRSFSKLVNDSPVFHTQLLTALDFAVGPSYEVLVTGRSQSKDTRAMLKALHRNFIPNKVLIFTPTDKSTPVLDEIAEYTKNYSSIDGKATAYVCQNYVCSLPTTDIDEMLNLLNGK